MLFTCIVLDESKIVLYSTVIMKKWTYLYFYIERVLFEFF